HLKESIKRKFHDYGFDLAIIPDAADDTGQIAAGSVVMGHFWDMAWNIRI
ncbi:1643_t:CDS:2, partial [Funneliformis geosporum]